MVKMILGGATSRKDYSRILNAGKKLKQWGIYGLTMHLNEKVIKNKSNWKTNLK